MDLIFQNLFLGQY